MSRNYQMSMKNTGKYFNSYFYELAKRNWIESISGDNHWMKSEEYRQLVSKSWTEERKKGFSAKVSGDNHWTKKVDMKKHAENMRLSIDKEKHSNIVSKMMTEKNPMKNPEIAKKFKKPKERVICPHCGKEGGKPVMKRYHFDKCKELK